MRALIRFVSLSLMGATLCASSDDGQSSGFTDAPSGFEWYVFEAGDSACLRPLDWFVKSELEGDTAALFISKENIDEVGKFETGLTLNVIRKIRAKTGESPSQYARLYVDELVAKHDDAKRFENPPQQDMPGVGAAYVDEEASPPLVIYTFLLADDANDILRIYILEAPQSDWADVWARSEKMLNCRIRR